MIQDQVIVASLIAFIFGGFFGASVMRIVYHHSHLKKLLVEFEADRARIRAEFEEARKRITP